MRSWEQWQKSVKDEKSYHGQLSWFSVVSGQLRERNRISGCHFLYKFRLLQIQFQGTHWLLTLSLPGTALSFLSVLFCILRTWLGFLPAWDVPVVGSCIHRQINHQFWGPKNMARQKCGLHSFFREGPTNCCQLSGELSFPFFWLSLGDGSEPWEYSLLLYLVWGCLFVQKAIQYF